MKKVIIDRSKWLNTRTRYILGASMMLDAQGNRCCLGFIAKAEGVEDDKLLNVLTPGGVGLVINNLTESVIGCLSKSGKRYNSDKAKYAMELNDHNGMTTEGRERALQVLFADLYELEFVGEYPQ